jgi:hypothetical protein
MENTKTMKNYFRKETSQAMKAAHKPNNHSKTKPEKKKQGILINTKHREDKQK